MGSENLPSGWNMTTLAAIARQDGYGLVDGPFGSNLPASSYVPSGVPVIRGSNLSLGNVRFRDDEFVFVSDETASRLARSLCSSKDIIFTKKGTLGQIGLIPASSRYPRFLLSSNQMKLSTDPKIADPTFIYYYVSSPVSREKIIRDSEATGVPKTNLAYLRTFPILLPPLTEQHAIARILDTLDDKIELNRQMNKTLEAIAQALFKSWFVDFDPVRARMEGRQPYGMDAETAALFPDSFEDSVLGEIPKGWRVGYLGDIADNPRLGVHPEDIPFNTPYIGLEHMPRRSIALGEWGNAEEVSSNKFWFHQGDILFGKLRPYFHKVGVAVQDGVCSTDILVIAPQSPEWFGLVLSHISSVELINYANASSDGTRMPRTNWQDMKRYEIAIPSKDIAQIYNEKIKLVVLAIRSNILQSRTLAAIRDILLPKLLSGEIRVKDAERFMEVHV